MPTIGLERRPGKTFGAALPPSRAALARAIEAVNRSRDRLDEAQRPLTGVDRIRAAAIVQEAAALRAEVKGLRIGHDAEIGNWVDAGGRGDRPAPPACLVAAERRLGEIAAGIDETERRVSIASEGHAGAALRVGQALGDRECALWPASLEAAEPLIAELTRTVTAVLDIEVRLRSLVSALRETGRRDSANGHGAFVAAEKIEKGINAARRGPAVASNAVPGRALIERLRSDPRAVL